MTEIGYYRYEGFDLRTKFSWINGAVGLQATEPARIGMGNLGNAFVASDDAIRGLLAPLGLQWHGQAAEATAGALARAADRAGTAGLDGGAGSSAVAGYGQSFEEMRPKIAWQDPGSWDWWDMGIDVYGAGMRTAFGDTFDVQSDFTATLEENRTLDARANEALYSHEQVSRERLEAFPLVEPASAPTVPGAPGGSGTPPFPSPGPLGADPVGIGPASGPPAPPGVAAPPGSPTVGRFAPDTIGIGGNAGPPAVSGAQIPGAVPGIGPAGGLHAPGSSRPGSTNAGSGVGWGSAGTGSPTPAWGGSERLPAGIGRGGVGTNGATGLSGGPGRPLPAGGSGVGLGRGGTNGGEFAGRLPGGSEQSGAARPGAGAGDAPPGSPRANGVSSGGHAPFLGGMGAGAGAGPTEHKVRYWIPSTEAFDVDLPPHTEAVIEGRDG
jgi:hypothetical protein